MAGADRRRPRALAGRRVVVTRSVAQSASLAERLRRAGAEPVAFPVIRFEALPAPELAALAADGFAGIDWIVFTSVNAVERLFSRLGPAAGRRIASLATAAIGEATERALRERGTAPRLVPEEFRGEALVDRLAELGALEGARVLLPRSRRGRPEISEGLRARGAEVVDVALYDTVRVEPERAAVAELARGFDALTFTSPSAVRNFLAIAAEVRLDAELVASAVTACIGPVTADEARGRGLEPRVVPSEFTVSALVTELERHFADVADR